MSATLESLRADEAEKFVRTNGYWIERKEEKFSNPSEYRCMDDRDTRRPDDATEQLPSFAVPGSTFGMVLDSLLAAEIVAEMYGKKVPIEALYQAAEKAVDVVTYHTDMAHSHDEVPCSGCGYCGTLLAKLSPEWRTFISSKFVLNAGTLNARSIRVPSYVGAHAAKALMLLKQDHIGLPATGEDGTHVYVINEQVRTQGLEKIGQALYPILKVEIPELTEEEWLKTITNEATENLKVVAEKLGAHKLPCYEVSEEEGQFAVRAMTADTQTEAEIAA